MREFSANVYLLGTTEIEYIFYDETSEICVNREMYWRYVYENYPALRIHTMSARKQECHHQNGKEWLRNEIKLWKENDFAFLKKAFGECASLVRVYVCCSSLSCSLCLLNALKMWN